MLEQTRRCNAMLMIPVVIAMELLTGCWQSPTTGPGEVRWNRQTCERCQMVISERRHAVQIRAPGKRNTHAFDDLGCALLWLDEQGLTGSEPPRELWVQESTGTHWIDGHTARFEDGLPTPMAYGFGVAEAGISLGEVHDRVREAEQRRRRDRTKTMGRGDGNGG